MGQSLHLNMYTPVDMCFSFFGVCGYVCEMSLECVVCSVCHIIFQFSKTISFFLCGFVVMC